jgi:hypothetical protein
LGNKKYLKLKVYFLNKILAIKRDSNPKLACDAFSGTKSVAKTAKAHLKIGRVNDP